MNHLLAETPHAILLYNTTNNKWLLQNRANGQEYDAAAMSNMSAWLHFFYEDPAIFFTALKDRINEQRLDRAIINSLPFEKSIHFCVQSKLYFWLDLSLKWLPYCNISAELNRHLKELINDKTAPQALRHKLQKQVREL